MLGEERVGGWVYVYVSNKCTDPTRLPEGGGMGRTRSGKLAVSLGRRVTWSESTIILDLMADVFTLHGGFGSSYRRLKTPVTMLI